MDFKHLYYAKTLTKAKTDSHSYTPGSQVKRYSSFDK